MPSYRINEHQQITGSTIIKSDEFFLENTIIKSDDFFLENKSFFSNSPKFIDKINRQKYQHIFFYLQEKRVFLNITLFRFYH